MSKKVPLILLAGFLGFILLMGVCVAIVATNPDTEDKGGEVAEENVTESTADTVPPVISAVAATEVSQEGAEITWNTDEAATSQVEYGPTSGYGSASPSDANLVASHSVFLSGLTSGTTYHFRVKSNDVSTNEAISGDAAFTTAQKTKPDTTAPVISNVVATEITENSAKITWNTDEAATSQVEYGPTLSYGSGTSADSSLVTSHGIGLSGLTAGSTYHCRVRSKDASGNEAVSGDNTLTTVQPVEAVQILSHSSYVDGLGYYHVVGEVKNNNSKNLTFVRLTATFYDNSSTVVGTDFTYARVDVLVPGQKSPFELTLIDTAASAKVNHYVVVNSDYNVTTQDPYRGFQILSHTHTIDILGYYNVAGEVKNTGSQAATYVRVEATFYDSTGAVIAADFTYTDPDALASGQIAPFKLTVIDNNLSAKIASYELQVQC